MLPSKLNLKQKIIIEKNNILTFTIAELISLAGKKNILQVWLSNLMLVIKMILSNQNIIMYRVNNFRLITNKWDSITSALSFRKYITSVTDSWPDTPVISKLKSLNIHTIIWSYSSAKQIENTKPYSNEQDGSVIRSFISADEFWVWNNYAEVFFNERLNNVSEFSTCVLEKGPLMCGKSNYSIEELKKIKSELNISDNQFLLCVYELPIFSDNWIALHSNRPSGSTFKASDLFFQAMEEVLVVFPEITLLIKRKRKDSRYIECDALKRLTNPDNIWSKSGRVVILDPNLDPFIPILLSNCNVGMPYVSPVVAGYAFDKNGIYYDPEYFTKKEISPYNQITIYEKEDLIEFIKKSIVSDYHQKIPNCLIPNVEKLDEIRN